MPEHGLGWGGSLVGVLAAGGVLAWAFAPASAPTAVRDDAARGVPVRTAVGPGPRPLAAAAPAGVSNDAATHAASAAADSPRNPVLVQGPYASRQRFDALRWSGARPAELDALARDIDAALPVFLAEGRVGAGDALMLKADVLDVLEFDPALRRARLRGWWAAHPLAGPPLAEGDARAAEEERRELMALDEWQAQRSEDRDAGELAEKLQDMRVALSRRSF